MLAFEGEMAVEEWSAMVPGGFFGCCREWTLALSTSRAAEPRKLAKCLTDKAFSCTFDTRWALKILENA